MNLNDFNYFRAVTNSIMDSTNKEFYFPNFRVIINNFNSSNFKKIQIMFENYNSCNFIILKNSKFLIVVPNLLGDTHYYNQYCWNIESKLLIECSVPKFYITNILNQLFLQHEIKELVNNYIKENDVIKLYFGPIQEFTIRKISDDNYFVRFFEPEIPF